MIDRGIIKWRPFDSCYSSKQVVNEVKTKRLKINMPILSDDQKNSIEEKIVDAFNLQTTIKIEYFYDGFIKNEIGKINYIDKDEKKIYLNNKSLYFKQILKITSF